MDFNFGKYKDNRLVIGSSKVHGPHAKWLWFNFLELNVAYVEFHEISNNILEQENLLIVYTTIMDMARCRNYAYGKPII
jgi:hypothetical protein